MFRTILRRLTTDVDGLHARIRGLVADLDAARSRAAAAEVRVGILEADLAHYRRDLGTVTEENARLRAVAGNLAPTPAEAVALDVVRSQPGLDAATLGVIIAGAMSTNGLFAPYEATNATKHLTALHRKGLVRRERAGHSYRYWPMTGGGDV